MVFSTTGEDLTSKVQVTGTIDTSKKGTYELVYSLVDSNNVTITKVRKIVVMSSEINLSLSKSEYTNKNIKIKVSINDEYFDYLILPDNGKITQNPYEYEVSENGKYTFKVYNNKGMLTESSIEVTNIDKILPTGSCQGKYKDGISTITVTANDNIGINNYEYNGKIYNSKTITINSEIKKANIKIYDKSGNEKIISCNLENKNDIIFNKNITYSYEYVYKANGVSYALYTPSTASTNETVPLIIWLHGSGSRGISKKDFRDNGLIGIVDDWTLDNFNAYILCPHISKETTSSWGSGNIKEKFYVIFEEILQNKNIDKNKIVLSGHSMGGIGVYDVANGKSDYFSAFTVMSGYNTRTDLSQYQNKPIKGYVGTPEKGEDESSYKHMTKTFINKFGQENLNILEVSHGALPKKAFNIDKNNDNKSDLIEWMLNQKK